MNIFNTILIANRGEIAVRVIKTAKKMGYHTVAVYSDADAGSLHVSVADTAVCIGGTSADQSYLDIDKILHAAARTNAGAIHPGYGFLSESTEFAERCEQAGVTFVGPSARAISLMGNKTIARQHMVDAAVPLVPGYDGDSTDDSVLQKEAERIGYPVMVKAAAGGGGRGIRLVRDAAKLVAEIASARGEALSSFGSDELLLEKCIEQARHIEIQVFADQMGNTVYLGERDCSMQRRNQKVIEESPAPLMNHALRKKMGEAAVEAAKSVNYVGAGTVEFLVTQSDEFYFLEMNTRLQVEHPVTELVTGLDLVEWQLRVAAGEPLPLQQHEISLTGHAIEVRLYAEDCDSGFTPQTGTILEWIKPTGEGVRVDEGISKGQEVSPYYDSMLAKLITYGSTRDEALRRLKHALTQTVLLGLPSNKQFLLRLLADPVFVEGKATTRHIEDSILEQQEPSEAASVSQENWALAAVLLSRTVGASGWRSTGTLRWPVRLKQGERTRDFFVSQDNDQYCVDDDEANGLTLTILKEFNEQEGQMLVLSNDMQQAVNVAFGQQQTLYLDSGSETLSFQKTSFSEKKTEEELGANLVAPMSGRIAEVKVSMGQSVKKGDLLIVLESMKMFQELTATQAGVVSEIYVTEDTQVEVGMPLVDIEQEEKA